MATLRANPKRNVWLWSAFRRPQSRTRSNLLGAAKRGPQPHDLTVAYNFTAS